MMAIAIDGPKDVFILKLHQELRVEPPDDVHFFAVLTRADLERAVSAWCCARDGGVCRKGSKAAQEITHTKGEEFLASRLKARLNCILHVKEY